MKTAIDALPRYLAARCGLDQRSGNRADAGLARPATADDHVISDWVVTEFSSALSIKLRTGQITQAHRAGVLAMFTRLANESFAVVSISRAQFRSAARFADQHALGLRAGDALHLAICADHGAALCTLDRRLGDAGSALGVKALLL